MTDIANRLRALRDTGMEVSARAIADQPHHALNMLLQCLNEIETLQATLDAKVAENVRLRANYNISTEILGRRTLDIGALRADLDVVVDYLPESHWDSLKVTHPEVAKRLSRFT